MFFLNNGYDCFKKLAESAPIVAPRLRIVLHDALALKRITFYKDRQRFDNSQQEEIGCRFPPIEPPSWAVR